MTSRLSFAALLITLAASSAQAQQFGNPIVGGSDHHHISYDPFSDTTYVDNTRHRIRESYYDYDRNIADPGSRQYVDRYYKDQHGRTVHEYGWTWTSGGKPHGDLTREVVTYTPNYPRRGCQNGGGTVHRDRDVISYSTPNQGGTVRRDRDVISYSPQQGQQGGTVRRDRDIVSFGAQTQQQQQPKRNNNLNNAVQMFGQFLGK